MWPAVLVNSSLALLGAFMLGATVPVATAEEAMKQDKTNAIWSDLPLPKIGIRQEDPAPFSGKGIETYLLDTDTADTASVGHRPQRVRHPLSSTDPLPIENTIVYLKTSPARAIYFRNAATDRYSSFLVPRSSSS